MRRIISMSRRRACTVEREREMTKVTGGGEGGGREGGGTCRKHAMTQTGWRLGEPLLYPTPSRPVREPLREMHTPTRAHVRARLYTRHTYAPLVLGIVITGSARNHSCWRRKSLRIAARRIGRSLAFPTRNIYNHSAVYYRLLIEMLCIVCSMY